MHHWITAPQSRHKIEGRGGERYETTSERWKRGGKKRAEANANYAVTILAETNLLLIAQQHCVCVPRNQPSPCATLPLCLCACVEERPRAGESEIDWGKKKKTHTKARAAPSTLVRRSQSLHHLAPEWPITLIAFPRCRWKTKADMLNS